MSRGNNQGGNSGMNGLMLQLLRRLERRLDLLEGDHVVIRPCQQCRNGYKIDYESGKFIRDADLNLITCEICNGRGEHVYRVNELSRQVVSAEDDLLESAVRDDPPPRGRSRPDEGEADED